MRIVGCRNCRFRAVLVEIYRFVNFRLLGVLPGPLSETQNFPDRELDRPSFSIEKFWCTSKPGAQAAVPHGPEQPAPAPVSGGVLGSFLSNFLAAFGLGFCAFFLSDFERFCREFLVRYGPVYIQPQ